MSRSSEAIQRNPFGRSITLNDILDALAFFDSWEDKYKYIIDLGRELPRMEDEKKNAAHLVRGCQSQVWIDQVQVGGQLWFEVDSDAFIVKGLLGVVLAAFNGKTPGDILAFDVDSYFDQLGLLTHLSPTRGNGLRAMVRHIRQLAEASSKPQEHNAS